MEFKLREIKDKKVWEDFMSSIVERTFLQSWNWGDFNQKTGSDILRYGIFQGEDLVSTAFVFKVKAKRGSFIFLPHGPNLKEKSFSFKKEIIKSSIFNFRRR